MIFACAVWSCAAPAHGRSARPDLVVSALETPSGLKQGNCNVFDVTVENVEPHGTQQAITVRLHLQYANRGEGQHIKVVNGIAPKGERGASVTVRFTGITLPAGGRVSYIAVVNPDGIVPETVVDERNSVAGVGVIGSACS